MLKAEQKLIQWGERHLLVIFFILVSVCGFFARYYLRDFSSTDANCCLLPWYDTIRDGGGLNALKEQVGNYNIMYQTLIALMTYLPIPKLYAYKCLSGLFDYALAAACGIGVYRLAADQRAEKALFCYTLVLFSPIVLLNSAVWAQCDSIYCFFIVAAFVCLFREHYGLSLFLLGLAFTFKLQAVFALPFFLLFWFMKKRFSILNFLLIPAALLLSAVPAAIYGRANAFSDVFGIYLTQADTYSDIYLNYPSFWCLIASADSADGYELFKNTAMILTVVILISFAVMWIREKIVPNIKNALYMLFILSYTCVLFLPAMHERYGFLYEVLAIMLLFVNKKTQALCPLLIGLSLFTYSEFLFSAEIPLTALAVVNCMVYVGYVILLTKDMRAESTALTSET